VFHRLLVVVVVLASCAAGRAEDNFKSFTTNEGKFTVLMVGTPKEKKQVIKAAGSDTTLNFYVNEIDAKRALVVSFNDLSAFPPSAIDDILDKSTKSVNSALKGKVLSLTKISLGEHPGREVQIRMPDKGLYKAHILLVGNRLYQVIAVGPEEFMQSPPVAAYFKSFKVTE
jgi:hypothetical protein